MSPIADFDQFYQSFLEGIEGGVHKDDTDLGGHTWYGISAEFLKLIGRTGPITKAEAKEIFREYFWNAGQCDTLPPVVAWCYCDALIQHPPGDAARILQRSIGARVDGKVGPITLSMARKQKSVEFWERYRIYRAKYYRDVIVSHPEQVDKLAGWIERQHKLPESMVKQGLFSEAIRKLPWYRGKEVKTTALGLGGFAAFLGLIWPEGNWSEILASKETLKAAIAAMLMKYAAGMNFDRADHTDVHGGALAKVGTPKRSASVRGNRGLSGLLQNLRTR